MLAHGVVKQRFRISMQIQMVMVLVLAVSYLNVVPTYHPLYVNQMLMDYSYVLVVLIMMVLVVKILIVLQV